MGNCQHKKTAFSKTHKQIMSKTQEMLKKKKKILANIIANYNKITQKY